MSNLLGEFFGTAVLIILGCGVCANVCLKKSKGEGSGWIVIATGWGFGVFIGAVTAVAAGAPQADLNPAVTLAKAMIGIYSVPQAIATMFAEIAGGIAGGIITWLAYLPHWEVTEDKATKLGVFATAPAIRSTGANFLCELIATAVLVIGLLVLGAKPIGGYPAGIGCYLAGVLIWALGLSLGGPTGYAMNPARDLGPRIAHAILPIAGKGGSDWTYALIPILGPFAGGAIAVFICQVTGVI